MEEEKIKISVNQEDIQNIINCYEKDIKRIKKLEEVIKEAMEYVEEHRIKNPYHYEYNCFMGNARASDLLEILSKGENK